nr:hypothetical protein [Deltaproteobacteria bacterium]
MLGRLGELVATGRHRFPGIRRPDQNEGRDRGGETGQLRIIQDRFRGDLVSSVDSHAEKLHRDDRDRDVRPDVVAPAVQRETDEDDDDPREVATDRAATTQLASLAMQEPTQNSGSDDEEKQQAEAAAAKARAKEKKRKADEAKRKAAEVKRKADEEKRKADEEKRKAAEAKRKEDEEKAKVAAAARAKAAAEAAFRQRTGDAAAALNRAMKGMGTDEDAIFAVLKGKSAAEIAAIKVAYKALTSRSLDADLADEMGGSSLGQAKALLAQDPVQSAVQALRTAMEGWGTDEAKVKEILHSLKDPELKRKVIIEYEKATGERL